MQQTPTETRHTWQVISWALLYCTKLQTIFKGIELKLYVIALVSAGARSQGNEQVHKVFTNLQIDVSRIVSRVRKMSHVLAPINAGI